MTTGSNFTQLDLSPPILKLLQEKGFSRPTPIQSLVIPRALAGDNIIAQAPTGSGKTLAFVLPLLESMLKFRVTQLDGPIAIILTPTRELSRQIYSVIKTFSPICRFTMMNIMGGGPSSLTKKEWASIARANVLVGTPGRFVQHLTENPLFDSTNVKLLVIDEADRLLDATFRRDVDLLLDALGGRHQQTLLLSATQASCIGQLARLRLANSPVILSTASSNRSGELMIPAKLEHSYVVVELGKKLDLLWSFLQSHCQKKLLVFFSTQKQVRFVYELFLQLRPYYRLLQLRGNMSQQKRFRVYDQFSATPRGCVLLATNVAERGLDFPAIDWVVQFDCPHQSADYLHRVGRTARSGRVGRAILFLLPSETKFVDLLAQSTTASGTAKLSDNEDELSTVTVPKCKSIPPAKVGSYVSTRIGALMASKPEMATTARSYLTAYLRDYRLVAGSNKSVFNASQLPLDALASSLGLASLPSEVLPCVPSATNDLPRNSSASLPPVTDDDDFLVKKKDKLLLQVSSSSSESEADDNEKSNEGGDAFRPSSRCEPRIKQTSRVSAGKKALKHKIRDHVKIDYDEDGQPISKRLGALVSMEEGREESNLPSQQPASFDLTEARRQFKAIDVEDKKRWKERVKAARQAEKRRRKATVNDDDQEVD